jgi:hypothetical protein
MKCCPPLVVAVGLVLTLGTVGRGAGEDESGKAGWTMDLGKMKVPEQKAAGRVHGEAFHPDRAVLHNGILTLRQGKDFFPDRDVSVFLHLKDGEAVAGKSYKIVAAGKEVRPHVHLTWKPSGEKLPRGECFAEGYVLLLRFGKVHDGKVDGKIYLCFPDEQKSFVAGLFTAEVK